MIQDTHKRYFGPNGEGNKRTEDFERFLEKVQILVEAGADTHAKAHNGKTPVQCAAFSWCAGQALKNRFYESVDDTVERALKRRKHTNC